MSEPLHGLRVLEVSGSVAGAYCAKMFADFGAVVSVAGPRKLTEHQHAVFDEFKDRIADHDLNPVDVDLSTYDVLIESSAPEPLAPWEIDDAFPDLVRVQISPLGHGVHEHWHSTDLTDYARSGHAYLYGDPEREPLRGPPDQPAIASGLFAFIGAMAALLARPQLGRGQIVAVSHLQVMAALHQVTLLTWTMTGTTLCRMGNRYTGVGQPNGPYECRDGWVSITAVTEPQVEGLLAVTGLMHLLDHPDIDGPLDFQLFPDMLDEPLSAWLSDQPVDEVVQLFQAVRIPTAPALSPRELLDDPQLLHRKFFRQSTVHPQALVPGRPFTITPAKAPDTHDAAPPREPWEASSVDDGPLSGLRVLDLARVWAGPLCGRILSDLGADVVWVESPWNRGPQHVPQSVIQSTRYFPNDDGGDEPWNRNGHFAKYSMSKQSLALDLQCDEGRKAFARIVPQFDVLLENFSARVMPQLGFGEHRLHELNPNLTYLTMPGYGRTGPATDWLAYGSCVDSHAGLSTLIGYEGCTPWKGGVAWPDPIAGLHACAAVLITLWSGTTGVTIEAAQFESTVAAIGDRILEAQIDTAYVPQGNRDQRLVAQGIYRCAGDDAWIAISITNPSQFDGLGAVLAFDPSALFVDGAFCLEQFDKAVETQTSTWRAGELAAALQAVGVPAAPVAKAADLLADLHLKSTDTWCQVAPPVIGPMVVPATPISLSSTPLRRPRVAPTLGEHNHEVLSTAGFTAAEIDALTHQGAIVTMPPG